MQQKNWRLFIIALLAATVLNSCHVGRFFIYNFANISDYKKFPNRALTASEAPFRFYEASVQKSPKEIEYKGKTRQIAGSELITFFRADENKCSFDPASGVIKAVVKDGVRQFPSLYPQEANLKPEIEKLAK